MIGIPDDTANRFDVRREGRALIALAGNPNVGKSTIFNALTGLNQHTGNWPGKTVGSARGIYRHRGLEYVLIDLPGTYSLNASSQEEEIARDFLLYGGADTCIVVCDATCLERNLNLAIQTAEITRNVVLCLNLMDEAGKKGIDIDAAELENQMGIAVAATSARSGGGLTELTDKVGRLIERGVQSEPISADYPEYLVNAVKILAPALEEETGGIVGSVWLALRVLEDDRDVVREVERLLGKVFGEKINHARSEANKILENEGVTPQALRDIVTESIFKTAERVCQKTVMRRDAKKVDIDRRLDRIFTGKLTGIPMMLLLLGVVFWLTISGTNYPSAMLSRCLFWIEGRLTVLFELLNAPSWLHGALVLGVYRVLAWVVSVMLPPMAIFFPLFTLLEDFGYLPRVAFNLDHQFKKACACGKQALTMCAGNLCTLRYAHKKGENRTVESAARFSSYGGLFFNIGI